MAPTEVDLYEYRWVPVLTPDRAQLDAELDALARQGFRVVPGVVYELQNRPWVLLERLAPVPRGAGMVSR